MTDDSNLIFAAEVRQLRDRHGLTQAELALRLNVSERTVTRWETGLGKPRGRGTLLALRKMMAKKYLPT